MQESLVSRLHCTHKDKSPNWTAIARSTIKLLPFSRNIKAYESHITRFVYNYVANKFGRCFVEWNNLFDENTKHVKDHIVKFEIKINAEDPNRLNRSIAKF